jgi:hypothetical protein
MTDFLPQPNISQNPSIFQSPPLSHCHISQPCCLCKEETAISSTGPHLPALAATVGRAKREKVEATRASTDDDIFRNPKSETRNIPQQQQEGVTRSVEKSLLG